MRQRTLSFRRISCLIFAGCWGTQTLAGWTYFADPSPSVLAESDLTSLELQCDRLRFIPAGYEDSEDILANQGLSIRFMSDGNTETGAFQVGEANVVIRMVDDYPVETLFDSLEDDDFVLDQLAANAALNLSMNEQDMSYGIFDLSGSAAVIKSLKVTCR